MSAVEVDSKGRIYVLHRGEPPLLQFDKNGQYVKGWGEGTFKVAHGLRIDRDDNIWTTDNALHVIRKFSPEGKLLLTLGEEGKGGDDEKHFRSPDDLVFNAARRDVYRGCRQRPHRASQEGRHVHRRMGTKGQGQPHGPASLPPRTASRSIAKGRIYVADRGNKRIQVFAPDGKFVAEWTGFGNPFGALVVGNELLVSDGDANTISHLSLRDGKMVKQWGDAEMLEASASDGRGGRQKSIRGGSERQANPALRSRPLISKCVITDDVSEASCSRRAIVFAAGLPLFALRAGGLA